MLEIIKNCAEVISAYSMLFIAGIVAWIAFWQYKVNRERHRFELYEKRFSIYKELKLFILDTTQIKNFVTEENLKKIYRITDEAVFLFRDDITQYMNEIKSKIFRLHQKETKLMENDSSSKALKEIARLNPLLEGEVAQLKIDIDKLKLWFDEQLEILPKKFSKYLKFDIEKKCTF